LFYPKNEKTSHTSSSEEHAAAAAAMVKENLAEKGKWQVDYYYIIHSRLFTIMIISGKKDEDSSSRRICRVVV